jgi:hypothetical protein
MSWSEIQTATQVTSIAGTEKFFTELIGPLNPGESVEVHMELNPWDDTPFQSYVIPNAPDPSKISFTIYGRYQVRVGVVRIGTTDTHTSCDMEWRRDGVSV